MTLHHESIKKQIKSNNFMTENEQEELVSLLKKLKPGFQPYEVFEQLARLTVLSIIEFVPLRMADSGKIEILLLERGNNAPIWPGEVHTPGTVIRPGDNAQNTYLAFDRILNDELKGTAFTNPHFVGSILHESKRGSEHAQVYWIEPQEPTQVGKWYDVDKLPDNLIESQRTFIQAAIENYKKQKSALNPL